MTTPAADQALTAPAPSPGVYCAWWALCDHQATHYRPHPVLGDVPICDRCEDKITTIKGGRS
jgi:hypothetical protein